MTLDHQRAPLADRMRPRSLDQLVGQDAIVGPGRLLRRAIEADRLSSLIFHGPPGTGKTTLARIIARTTEAHFVALNAVLAGVADIRKAVKEAEARRADMFGQRTILFVDEVHRFNKAQQDALLPWVENGTLTLIGATTENPFFEVNKALVSRSRVFQLAPLGPADLEAVARMALTDPERGYGDRDATIDEDALAHLVDVANGDARALLNALELAVETTPPDEAGRVRVTLPVAEESIQRRAVLYDKEGDAHYDTISAFIKSIRGSDPDAALYWLARMVYAGEDPRFLFRRMYILASEDVGLADPAAVSVVDACARAYDYVGLPEGQFHLAQAALHLATAPKSNSTLGYFDALSTVRDERTGDVPDHLRDGNRDAEAFGHGAGYLYPHAYRDHWVAQQYLPGALQGRLFYEPGDQGAEAARRDEVQRRREAQLAAMTEAGEAAGGARSWSGPAAEDARADERWLARATSGAGARLAALRDALFGAAPPARHDRVLDLRAGSGLLAWEALRRVPEGGVWALVDDEAEAERLAGLVEPLGLDRRPELLVGGAADLPPKLLGAVRDEGLRFERLVGRGALGGLEPENLARALDGLAALQPPGGTIALWESVPADSSRPSDLLEGRLEAELLAAVRDAEAEMLASAPGLAFRPEALAAALEAAGWTELRVDLRDDELPLRVGPELVARWTEDGPFAEAAAARLDPDAREVLRAALAGLIGREPRPWRVRSVLLVGRRPAEPIGSAP